MSDMTSSLMRFHDSLPALHCKDIRRLPACLVLATVLAAASCAAAAEGLEVLESSGHGLLHQHLLGEVSRQYAARRRAINAALVSTEAMRERGRQLRAVYRELLGPLPPRTPLAARTVATLACDGYVIEKVIYESRPRHHVTANLYLPQGTHGRVPGVLVPCGHSENGKANEAYQSACVLLARNGCAALIYDPIGQGERHQVPTLAQHGTTEHTLVGLGALAVGWNAANYRVWDGLRSLDYLAGRPEVDPARLGCTGNSGGGTLTTWLMALDERIVAAAPSCFITTVERLFATIGPQDCEQHFPAQGARGIDHADFITMRAPRPTLILAAERDYFDFAGTRAAYAEAEAVYRVLGYPERVGLFSYDDAHGFSRPRREAAVRWMRRWLADDDRAIDEPEPKLKADADLQVTERGQVLAEFADEVTVVDLAKARARELAGSRQAAWQELDAQARGFLIRRTLGISGEPEAKPIIARRGIIAREGYTIEKIVIERAGQVPLPALLFVPAGAADARLPAVLVADGRGKAALAETGGEVDMLVAAGNLVLSVDLSGCGETADEAKEAKYHNDEFRVAMLAMHVGRPLVGQRVADLLATLEVLCEHARVDAASIRLVAIGRTTTAALHAAVIEPRFRQVTLRGDIRSWADDLVARPTSDNLIGQVVPGALVHYDLTDLAAILCGRLHIEPGQ